jgi:hypothetical protein
MALVDAELVACCAKIVFVSEQQLNIPHKFDKNRCDAPYAESQMQGSDRETCYLET